MCIGLLDLYICTIFTLYIDSVYCLLDTLYHWNSSRVSGVYQSCYCVADQCTCVSLWCVLLDHCVSSKGARCVSELLLCIRPEPSTSSVSAWSCARAHTRQRCSKAVFEREGKLEKSFGEKIQEKVLLRVTMLSALKSRKYVNWGNWWLLPRGGWSEVNVWESGRNGQVEVYQRA